MFNDEQRAHMRYLASIPPELRCWCGWCRVGQCDTPCPCPPDVSLADRIRQTCEVCGGFPDARTGRMTHIVVCTAERRRDHYAAHDLGGEA